jgi:hypothetical protein
MEDTMKIRYIVLFSALFALLLFVTYIVGPIVTPTQSPKPMISVTKMDNAQIHFQDLLEQIRLENGLIDNRITWMLTLQGLFVVSLSFLLKDKPHRIAAVIVCCIGFVTCVTLGCSIVVGMHVLNELNPVANELGRAIAKEIGITPINMTGRASGVLSFLLPWRILPWFFAYVWIVIAILIWKIMPQRIFGSGSGDRRSP